MGSPRSNLSKPLSKGLVEAFMWLKCQGPGLCSLLRLRRQQHACMMELQIMANSDLGLFEKKRKK